MVTGWFAPGRFRLIGGILASGASVFAPQADGWYSVRGAVTVPTAGRVAKRVCGSVFYSRELFRPKLGTSVLW